MQRLIKFSNNKDPTGRKKNLDTKYKKINIYRK